MIKNLFREKPYLRLFSILLAGSALFIITFTLVQAAVVVTPGINGLPNSYLDGRGLAASSSPYAILRLDVWTGSSTTYLASTTIYFSGSGFSTSTLRSLDTGTSSGVSLIRDGDSDYYLGDSDPVATTGLTPPWNTAGATSSVTLGSFMPPISLPQYATTTFFVAIQTSPTATNSAEITAELLPDSVMTNYGYASFSVSVPYTSNSYTVDTLGPTVVEVNRLNTTKVEIIFNEGIMQAGQPSNYTFSDGLSVINSMVDGMNRVQVEADGLITPGSTTISISSSILDEAGNPTSDLGPHQIGSSSTRVLISEMSAYYNSDSSEFVELYNPGGQAVNISEWRLQYSGPNNGTTWSYDLANIPANTYIQPYSFYLLSSTDFDSFSPVDGDDNLNYSNILSMNGGHVRLYDYASSKEMDRLGWGMAVSPEGSPATAHSYGESMERQAYGGSSAADMAPGGTDYEEGNSFDSNNNQWDFVVQASSSPQNASSTAEQPDFASSGGESGPMIYHQYVNYAPTGSDFTVYARMGDPYTTIDDITAELHYRINDGDKTDNAPADFTTVYGSHQANGYYKFTIPSATVTSAVGSGLWYYFKMTTDNTTLYMSGNSTADESGDESQVVQHPFDVTCGAPYTTYTISGTATLDGASTSADIFVLLEGTKFATTTDSSGYFEIEFNSQPGNFEIALIKEGYYDEYINDLYVNSGITAPSRTLYVDTGGYTGDSTNPKVMWSNPENGATGIPSGTDSYKILLGFSRDLDTSSFSTSTVLLATGATSTVSGYTVTYNPDTRESWMPTTSEAPYLGVITPPAAIGFDPGTTYHLKLTSNVRDTSGNAIESNTIDGGWILSFTTGWDTSGVDYGSGANMPPYILGIKPNSGALEIPRNTKIAIAFSDTMDSSSISQNGNIVLYSIDSSGNAAVFPSTAALDLTGKIAIITPGSTLTSNQRYRVVVTGAVSGASGITMNSAGDSSEVYRSSFETGSVVDLSAPTIPGSWPSSGSTNVPVNPGTLNIQFSENLDPSTVNTNTVKLQKGNSDVNCEIKYDPYAQSVYIIPKAVLSINTYYTMNLTGSSTGIKDMSGNALASDAIIGFYTGSSLDTQDPEIMFANGDDFGVAITFSEPMKSAPETDTTNWTYSVLNPNNYVLKWGSPGSAETGTTIGLSNAGLFYDGFDNTVYIESLGLDPASVNGMNFYVDMSSGNARDLSGNRVSSSSYNTFEFPVQDSADTDGMLGPGDYTDPSMSDMGMMMAGAFPMNAMAGQTTLYFIDIPTTRSIEEGGRIMITFPQGFDVSGAMKDLYSPINNDINEWNDGIITFSTAAESSGGAVNDGVTVNTDTRTIIVTTAGTSTQPYDYLHMDIKGISNSSIARDYNTGGYNVDIKTLDADGDLLESIPTMPFYINSAGQNTLTVNINLSGGTASGGDDYVRVFLDSPMTGPIDLQALVLGSSGSTTFSGLPSGDYMLFTEPSSSLDSNDYFGMPTPEYFYMSASTSKNITLTREGTGDVAAITVDIAANLSNEDIDVFANSPSQFRVKTLTGVNGSTSTTVYLPDGDWMIGVGPAMPVGPISGPIPMPDWIEPAPARVVISDSGSTIVESNGAANDGTIGLTVISAEKQIIGYVKDCSGNAIADAEVWAYQPMGTSMGSHARTDTNGKFVLKVALNDTYNVGAFKQGLPYVQEYSIVVKDNNVGTGDNNSTADIYSDGGAAVTTLNPFVIKIKKPAYTISGKVTAGGNAISYAPAWAERTDAPGHADTMTDSSGNYILYVDNGTWALNAYIPGYGDADTKVVVVDGANETQNLAPNVNTVYYTISGTVGIDTDGSGLDIPETPLTYLPIRAVKFDADGVYQGKEYSASTDSSGNYQISVPAGIYRVDIWTPNYGELEINNLNDNDILNEAADDAFTNNPANVDAGSGNVSNADIIIKNNDQRTVYIVAANASAGQDGFVNVEKVDFSAGYPKPTGFHYSKFIDDLSATTTIKLADGDYFAFLDAPSLGSYTPDASDRDPVKDDIVISATTTIHFTLPAAGTDTAVLSGTVYDTANATGSELADAWVWVGNPESGYHNGTQTAADGSYSLTVPIGTGYKMGADKPGFMSDEPQNINISGNASRDFTLTSGAYTISGKLFADINGGTADTCDDGEEIAGGFVRAETTECDDSDTSNDSDCRRAHAPVDGSGEYELFVSAGTWEIYGMADGYQETKYSQNLSVSSGLSDKNIELTANANWTQKTTKKPMTPATGGTVDDTAQSTSTGESLGTGVKLTIPPNALGNSTAAGNVNSQITSSVTKTNSTEPLGNQGATITATDNSGQAITNLSDYIDLEMVLYKQDVETASSVTPLTKAKLKATQVSYYDTTVGDWVNLPTIRKAYYKLSGDTEWRLATGTSATASTSFAAFIERLPGNFSDYKLVYRSKTNHLSIFAVIMPLIVEPAEAAPAPYCGDGTCNNGETCSSCSTDCGQCGGGGGGGSYTAYCSSIEYGDWQAECIGDWRYRNVISQSPGGCTPTAAQEEERRKLCDLNETEEESGAEEEETETTPVTTTTNNVSGDELYRDQAEMIFRAEVDEIMRSLGLAERNHEGERLSRGTLINKLGIDLGQFEPRVQYAMTNFITYGSPATAKLGWGERAGVMNSFRAAFGRWPQTAGDWQDVVKIAQGRWPTQRSEEAESRALGHFRKIYLREPDRSNPHDDAAVTVITYGLRPAKRNLNSEAVAIRTFRAIYGYDPAGATDWDVVRAIAYSGAVR